MKKGNYAEKRNVEKEFPGRSMENRRNAQIRKSLIEGYKEMSRINLSLADSALAADNDAMTLCEQKLAECE